MLKTVIATYLGRSDWYYDGRKHILGSHHDIPLIPNNQYHLLITGLFIISIVPLNEDEL